MTGRHAPRPGNPAACAERKAGGREKSHRRAINGVPIRRHLEDIRRGRLHMASDPIMTLVIVVVVVEKAPHDV